MPPLFRHRRLLPVLLIAAGCSPPPAESQASDEGRPAELTVPGEIEDRSINEASGIAVSRREPRILWVHEDSGAKARIYAIDEQGASLGRIKLDKADNDDWEDIAAFELDGEPYLVVADTGNNTSMRDTFKLYVIAEPDLAIDDKPEIEATSEIEFRYPDGPRDAEAVAVDAEAGRILILSKRDIPPRLYSVPLDLSPEGPVLATALGEVGTLPMPSRDDLVFAPKIDNWHWQPTAMDIAPDGSAIAILTYSTVYYYAREPGEDWVAALARPPLGFGISRIRDAEAIAFSADGSSLYLTVEKRNAPIIRIDMSGDRP